MLREEQPSSFNSSNSVLPLQCQQIFKQSNCPAVKVSELVSGVKLAAVVNRLLFEGTNSILSNQIITQSEERKGNNVINMNMILKQVKCNPKHKCPDHIAGLSTFKLIDNEQEMLAFVKWLAQCWRKNNSDSLKRGLKTGRFESAIEDSKENLQTNTENHDEPEGFNIKNRRDPQNRVVLRPQLQDQNEEPQAMEHDGQQNAREQNIFENVYFCDRDISPQQEDPHLNDSLQMSEKVSKKGSFKVFKPRTIFEDAKNKQIQSSSEKRMQDIESPEKEKAKLKNKTAGPQAHDRYYSDEKQSSARKTVPKMAERPPLYKKSMKDQTKSQIQFKGSEEEEQVKVPTPFSIENTHSSLRKETSKKQNQLIKTKERGQFSEQRADRSTELFKEIDKLEEEIKKESFEKSQQIRSHSRVKSNALNSDSRARSNRKLFKVEIREVSENQRISIIEWLISINLLNSSATNYFHQFHEICKNGVIFPEIINHHLGRSGSVSYFKTPVKSAQIHSNYQKVFTCLKDIPNFQSELLFVYEFFVPQVVENAFWSLLKSCQQCFQKGGPKKSRLYNRDTEIRQRLSSKLETEANSRIKTQKNESKPKSMKKSGVDLTGKQYEKLKYGSSNFNSLVHRPIEFKNETPKMAMIEKEQKSKRKTSLDFIKQLPEKVSNFKHEDLVQVEEPIQMSKVNKGYRELHELKKSHNTSSFINTPEKKMDNSMVRSRIASVNSVKKTQQKPQLPSISLQMEMKAIKFLKQKSYLNPVTLQPIPLFEDPIRNGSLLNKIIQNQLKISYKYHQRPRNIVDCKENFTKGFAQLKQSFCLVPSSYEFYYQNIIKGEMSLFYGLIWHIIAMAGKGPIGINALKNESAIMSISKNFNNPELNMMEKTVQEILFWIREIEQQSPQIADLQLRDFNHVSSAIVAKNLLYKIASAMMPQKYTLKPTYENPVNQMEQESNVKKMLSFYAHNKILKSELAWKAKSLVKKQMNTTIQILKSLMTYHKSVKEPILNIQPENPVISFVKFARNYQKQQEKGEERINEKLETTMANNSFPTVPVKKQRIEKKNKEIVPIQIPWMRSLGFSGDLSLNNGVILCRLICKLTMRSFVFNESPSSKAECLTNIRKALKLIDKFRWDEEDIASADEKTTLEIYKFLKQKYRHCYALKDLS